MSDWPHAAPVARALSRWFKRHARELPWRETRDPYRVWVSEIMLQQTRVETVLAYYEPFVERFATLDALASADQQEVLEAWSGLGYYRRARLLHKGAQYVTRELGGRMPQEAAALREIPGIGPYTAGALASIAFDRPEPLVDGNVARVASRLHAVRDPKLQGANAKEHWSFVQKVLEHGEPRVLAQALMELGATVCKPRQAQCDVCPVRGHCEAHAQGLQAEIPAPKVKKASPELCFDALGVRYGKRLLLQRRPDAGLLAGLWCLPLVERPRAKASSRPSSAAQLQKRVAASSHRGLVPGGTDFSLAAGRAIKHVFTHRVWHLQTWELRASKRPRRPNTQDYVWVEPGERPQGGVPSLTNKLLERLGF